ncbi:MAG: hypothetical protein ACFBRM_02535 [Pikeienuella sp.]
MPDPTEVPVAAPAPMAERLAPVKARVHEAFDTLSETTTTVPRLVPTLVGRMRGPLGQLVTAGQHRDTFDQRMEHLETATERLEGCSAAERAAALAVVAEQLVALSILLEESAGQAGRAFHAICGIAAGAESLSEDAQAHLSKIARRGSQATVRLQSAAELLSIEADGQAARIGSEVTGAAMAEADLSWLLALYTMDEERQIHRRAIARASEQIT